MTREEIIDAAKVMEAYANGKKIQYKEINGWVDNYHPIFNWDKYTYRVKPEPKCRPFKTKEECWEEMHKHPDFGWVKNKNNKNHCNIANIYKIRSEFAKISVDNCEYTLNEAFNGFTFTDNTPFGIKEEENE